ncbi:MAG: outer membrane beta-barrel protein [Gemmatimonadota bacterium]|nr:outer membrane beta-barrel protein [Gemmatimonadota bacterium]MDE2870465.1 outer membrane beta-barrel protein [Gemmatimonadota bacterium]
MNQLGFFLLFLSGALATQAPVSRSSAVGPSTVALTAGVNRTWTAPLPLILVTDGGGSSPVVRMRAGAEFTRPVRQRFALQFGAAYSQTGDIWRCGVPDCVGEDPPIESRRELDYLEFSVLGRMRIPDESKPLSLHVLAGPAVALSIACRTGSTAAEQLGDCRPTSSRSNVLLYGGAGVDARLNERLGATAGFLYGLSLRGFRGGGDHLRVLSLRGGLVYRIP